MNKDAITYRSPTYYELAAPPELDWRKYRGEDYFEYRRQWDERAVQRDPGLFPLHLDLDPTNRCNLGCLMCPRTFYIREGRKEWNPEGRPGDMDFSLYEKMVEEGAAKGLKSVKLNFLGEPLLYAKLADMVSVAAEAGLWVMINTNATLLTPDKAESLLRAGLTDIFFSFDSPYKEQYEAVRVGADYDKTLANIKSFMALKKSMGKKAVQTRASMVLPENLGPEESRRLKSDYVKLFRDLEVAEIGFGLPTVMGLDYEKAYGLFPGFVCPDIFRRMFVFWDGPVAPCCGDWERRLIMGDARRESLAEIWTGEKYTKLRAAHIGRAYETVPACRACSVPYLSTVDAPVGQCAAAD
ncbi:SPASM domain-containing protein [Deltaproteobacteria bacterium OttesenSCG-928-K17]|nr:SPASM domain-containing protein [Deltaproteobacteria bacterium OttesenSCG-928-K17]